eukprot:scaffold13773_cov76-Amphora_coffeaeformis.AAC.1
MNSAGVKVRREHKQVLLKIQNLEDTFRRAHDFATSETGAGIFDKEGEGTIKDAVLKICPYYYDLLPIMSERASAKPKATSEALDDSSDDELSFLHGKDLKD